jgi:hypothetical protein
MLFSTKLASYITTELAERRALNSSNLPFFFRFLQLGLLFCDLLIAEFDRSFHLFHLKHFNIKLRNVDELIFNLKAFN